MHTKYLSNGTIDEKETLIQKFWKDNAIFEKSVEKGGEDYTFYDGPPFATGLPHHGHIIAGTIKDVIPRYHTMKGKRVERRWGWDCHGLPLEVQAEKDLGISGRDAIEQYGVKQFNAHIRKKIFEYEEEWKKSIPRLGRFVDMDTPYKTMDSSFMESVWSLFTLLYARGRAYSGFNGVHLCPRCETILANHEVSLAYKETRDKAVYGIVPLQNDPHTSFIIWTTTPWTLPANTALAVNPTISYSFIEKNGHTYIVASSLKDIVEEGHFVKEVLGKELEGISYMPFFPYYESKRSEGAFVVHLADYVSEESGTGVVHLAPAFGLEDLLLAKEKGIPIISNVKEDGTYDTSVVDFVGRKVKSRFEEEAVDGDIIDFLKAKNRVFFDEEIVHEYPFCWRCKTPLINYATTSWFIDVPAYKEEMVRENKKVHWVPFHIRDGRFGKWLENARGWAVSRNRFWGAPLPVWSFGEKHLVIPSLEKMKQFLPQPKNTIVCMRHGESHSNRESIANGDIVLDKGLTKKGEEQVRYKARMIEKPDIIYTSPFLRTKQTAQIVAEVLGVETIIEDERLSELRFGEKEGADFSAIGFEERKTFGGSPFGMESLYSVLTRVISFIYDIDTTYTNKKILIVSHKTPLNLLKAHERGVLFEKNDRIEKYWERCETASLGNTDVVPLPFQPFPRDEMGEINLHRPYIDTVVLYDEKGNRYTHCKNVFDCWFESGSMPYAQHHYIARKENIVTRLFSRKKAFDPYRNKQFPADFIAEGLDQTRGWFYSLIAIGVGCFSKTPYKAVITNGLALAPDGKKLSKSENNYTDPMEIVSAMGADSLRFFLMNSPGVRGESFPIDDALIQEQKRKVVDRLYNCLHFYMLYGKHLPHKKHTLSVLDEWMFARIFETRNIMTESLDAYTIYSAAQAYASLVEDVSLWYVRRVRKGIQEKGERGESIRYTMREVMRSLSCLGAPFVPFVSEYIFLSIKQTGDGSKESVHLEDWQKEERYDPESITSMDHIRKTISYALNIRARAGIKVRQPLKTLSLPTPFSSEVNELIQEEVNVKEIALSDDGNIHLDTTLTDTLKREGFLREVIRMIQNQRKERGAKSDEHLSVVIDTSLVFSEEEKKEMETSTRTSLIFSHMNGGVEVHTNGMSARITIQS